MDLGIRGRRFAVVGGSKGMGLGTAAALAADGADLVLIARGRAALAAAAAQLTADHGVDVATVVSADGPSGAADAVSEAIERVGPLAGLAVTAGPMDTARGDFHTLDDEAWAYYFDNVLMLTVRTCRAVIPHLIANGGGTIVTTAAYSVHAQKPSLVHYTALKNAVASVSKNLAKTYGKDGIRVNCICPGIFATPLLSVDPSELEHRPGDGEHDALNRYALQTWKMDIALGRVGQPHEMGELAAFLLSQRAAYLTGALINIDGGTDF